MNSPTMPGQNSSGTKAASVVAVEAVIGQAMRLAREPVGLLAVEPLGHLAVGVAR